METRTITIGTIEMHNVPKAKADLRILRDEILKLGDFMFGGYCSVSVQYEHGVSVARLSRFSAEMRPIADIEAHCGNDLAYGMKLLYDDLWERIQTIEDYAWIIPLVSKLELQLTFE